MHDAVIATQQDGITAGFSKVWNSGATVLMPYVFGIVIGLFAEPSRMIGVWIQAIYLFGFLSCVFWYLSRIRKISDGVSLTACLSFLTAACLYASNGGVSDFRVDLLLCLSFGCTSVLMLGAYEQPSVKNYALVGIAAAIACLSRATAPVYLVFALSPIAGLALLTKPNRFEHLKGQAIAVVAASVLAGWFFVLQFDTLYYYYFVWNTDANASLTLMESAKHFEFAGRGIGVTIGYLAAAWAIGWLYFAFREQAFRKALATITSLRGVVPVLIWIGVSPVLMLVLRGAGLNPFVSLPAVVGLVLALMLPLAHLLDSVKSRQSIAYASICLVVALGWMSKQGWENHQPSGFNEMTSLQRIVDVMLTDSRNHGVKEMRYGVAQLTSMCTGCVYSTAMFDRDNVQSTLDYLVCDGIRFESSNTFDIAAEATWSEVEGETDDEKLGNLLAKGDEDIDYLILPDDKTAGYIAETFAHNVINRHQVKLRQAILDRNWTPISEPIATNENETVIVYRSKRMDNTIAALQAAESKLR